MTPRNRLLLPIVFLVWVIFGSHIVALTLHLYWIFPWFDILMHFLGGLWVGLFLLWFLYHSGYLPCTLLPKNTLAGTLLFGFMLGLLWEVFEVVVQTKTGVHFEGNWALDTVVDLTMDICGITLGALLGSALGNREEEGRGFTS